MAKTPIRVIEGTARPYEPFWRVRNAAESESGEPEIELYGPISEYSWWGDEITPAKFKEDLYKIGNRGPVTVRINSGGGEVFAASVIRSTLVDYPGRVTVRIDGLAASAATFVAMAGDVVKMQDTAFFMIHDPSIIAWGNEDDLKAAIDLLKTVKSGIVDAYISRTELSAEKLGKMMAAETWMTAKEALGYGFVDEVTGGPEKPAPGPANVAILNHYAHTPAVLLRSEAPGVVEPPAAEESGAKELPRAVEQPAAVDLPGAVEQPEAVEQPVTMEPPVDSVHIATPEEQRLRDEVHVLLKGAAR